MSDFGLAKRLDRDDELTQGSGALGTPHFMPPEQTGRRYGEIGPCSDVYALGATLYHLLTGRPPFTGDGHEVISKVQSEPPARPRSIRPDLPADLEGIVIKCLEKAPADRYPSAEALADDLDRFLAGQVPVAPPLTPRRRLARWAGRNRGWLMSVAAGLVVGVGLFLAGRFLPAAPPAEDPPKPPPVVLLGETGRPKWAVWPFGAREFFDAPEADGACAFIAERETLLELARDPGFDRYAVSAELRTLDRRERISDIASVGLYWGYARAVGTDEQVTDTFLTLSYNDYLTFSMIKLGRPQADAQLHAVAAVVRPGMPPDLAPATDALPKTRFSFPAANVAPNPPLGDWRRLRIEVTPNEVKAFFATVPGNAPHPFRPVTAEEINRAFQDPKTNVGKACLARGISAPPWQPRMPVGIWCRFTAVAVRNVIIEPLP